MCPAYVYTGGPTLCNQLCYKLISFGFDATIWYYNAVNENNVVENNYKQYKNSFTVLKPLDDKNNIIIFPEVYRKYADSYKNSTIMIWWMSVDNYFLSEETLPRKIIRKLLGLNKYIELMKKIEYSINRNSINNSVNLVQSEYAREFVLNILNSKTVFNLYDYLEDSIYNSMISCKRENIILYSPKRGYKFTKKLIKYMSDVKWIPLENLSKKEMVNLMCRAKVYVDFGNHPGKDRIPREAAICGCCIVTGKRGAAYNNVDICIPNKYKIEDRNANIKLIIKTISDLISDYDNRIDDYEHYREAIIYEEKEFDEQILTIFNRYTQYKI